MESSPSSNYKARNWNIKRSRPFSIQRSTVNLQMKQQQQKKSTQSISEFKQPFPIRAVMGRRTNSQGAIHKEEMYNLFVENDKREEVLFHELCYNIFNL